MQSLSFPAMVAVLALTVSPGLGSRNLATAGTLDGPEQRAAKALHSTTPSSAIELDGWNANGVGRIAPAVFSLALDAASCAIRAGDVSSPATLTVIDYSKPSTEPRLWVYDLKSRRLLYEELVAHGQGSGGNVPTRFSNINESHQSSLGLFVTDTTYVGSNGYSLRLDGLDRGFNDRARERAIVMHGAPYVSAEIAQAQGRLGRSWGCPALREGVAREVIDRIKGGGLVFAYYPNPDWLNASQYLGDCAAAAN